MPQLEPTDPTIAGPEYPNIFKSWIKGLKTAFMSIIEVFEQEMNKFLKEIYENANKQ